ncbi:LPXTG cell wall anchor domain-containing protein [Arthrobacter cavernae]|uniref:LPXTG cell wall anchor domain-containing protein n=1 Tax=Arthrobacter cavernae TaxID=2817681 RepID=A0A939HGS9_9MICC|nr:LPXTG cell wall anchor domain-containing protein [Arthrobacter cavernae]MBO1267712.1 LPXTG cell wall anchor domain-containing protein [Arthrobacter cavernae]
MTITNTQTGAAQAFGGGGAGSVGAARGIVPTAPVTSSVTADGSGKLSASILLPTAGSYLITAVNADQSINGSASVSATAASSGGNGNGSASGSGALAETGIDSNILIWSLVGGGALLAGAATVVAARRRQRSEA